ncbi:MAG: hypothetical protein IJH76_04230, partial [Clostridia bacterium]|nr:hypothetical protein [Clostridia bacterium]
GLNGVKASTFRCCNVICPYRASENHPFHGWLLLKSKLYNIIKAYSQNSKIIDFLGIRLYYV